MARQSVVPVGVHKCSGGDLEFVHREQTYDWKITDAPAHDAEGHEIKVKEYILTARPQGSEKHYAIGAKYGGVIPATKIDLSSTVLLERWWKDNFAEIAAEEAKAGRNSPPPHDVEFLCTAWVRSKNDRISEAAEGVVVELDITPSDPVGFSLKPTGPLRPVGM